MYLKMRSMMNSAKYYPTEAEKDVKNIFKVFFKGMIGSEGPDRSAEETEDAEKTKKIEEDLWESKEKITGEVISQKKNLKNNLFFKLI